jgi:hypothetical protein
MRKTVLLALGGVFLVLVVFIWQVAANLDSIVASVIEDVGSEVLKTKVTVSGVAINLKEGKAAIGGVKIANPDGYSSANLLEMEGIEVDLDIESLSQDVLVIESILIQNPLISYEGDSSGGSNMLTLLDNIDSGSSEEGGTADEGELKMIVDQFSFSGGHVKAISAAKPGEVLELNLPAIKLSDIGRSKGGVTADVVVEKITKELVNGIIEAAVKAGVNEALEEKKKGFMDKLGKKLKGDG